MPHWSSQRRIAVPGVAFIRLIQDRTHVSSLQLTELEIRTKYLLESTCLLAEGRFLLPRDNLPRISNPEQRLGFARASLGRQSHTLWLV